MHWRSATTVWLFRNETNRSVTCFACCATENSVCYRCGTEKTVAEQKKPLRNDQHFRRGCKAAARQASGGGAHHHSDAARKQSVGREQDVDGLRLRLGEAVGVVVLLAWSTPEAGRVAMREQGPVPPAAHDCKEGIAQKQTGGVRTLCAPCR